MEHQKDRIRGSLIGGAIGDALGYPVEFVNSFSGIQAQYGEQGITRLSVRWTGVDAASVGKAVVSDDTQMTLFHGQRPAECQEAERLVEIWHLQGIYRMVSHPDWQEIVQVQGLLDWQRPGTELPPCAGHHLHVLSVDHLQWRGAGKRQQGVWRRDACCPDPPLRSGWQSDVNSRSSPSGW